MDKSNKKSEKKESFGDMDFNFTSDQKVYWHEQQEKAVVEYLWLDAIWLQNMIKWEKESAVEENREPNKDLISTFKELIECSKDPEIQHKKSEIFRKEIYKPLNELVENIIFNFKLFRADIDVKT